MVEIQVLIRFTRSPLSFHYCDADLYPYDLKQSEQQCCTEDRIFRYASLSGGNEKPDNAVRTLRRSVLV